MWFFLTLSYQFSAFQSSLFFDCTTHILRNDRWRAIINRPTRSLLVLQLQCDICKTETSCTSTVQKHIIRHTFLMSLLVKQLKDVEVCFFFQADFSPFVASQYILQEKCLNSEEVNKTPSRNTTVHLLVQMLTLGLQLSSPYTDPVSATLHTDRQTSTVSRQ